MSDFERKDEPFANESNDLNGKNDGFAVDNGCQNEYELHEDHTYTRNGEDRYSRNGQEDYYSSGSGSFYRREAGTNKDGGGESGKKNVSGLAIASMVCGIISLVSCCIPYISVILAIIGLIFGIITISKGFNGFSLAGIIISSFAIVFGIIALVAMISSIGNLFDYILSIIDSSFDDPFDPNFGAAINSVVSVFKRL